MAQENMSGRDRVSPKGIMLEPVMEDSYLVARQRGHYGHYGH